jgi:hypothetical protein
MSSGSSCHALSRSIAPVLVLAMLSAEACAQAVTLAELAGSTVEADIHRRQTMQRNGPQFAIQTHQNWKLDINADNTIDVLVNTTVRGPRGTRKAPPNAGRFTFEQAREVRNRGGGQGIWCFADEALHFTRTFPSGAYRAHFTFTRGVEGISCKVTEAFAREDGNKPITLDSALGDGPVTMIESQQEPSDCRVSAAKPQ